MTDSKLFQLVTGAQVAAATSFTLTDVQKKYSAIAFDTDVAVSFNGGGEEFPLGAGIPMALPGNANTIEVDVAAKLFFGA